MTDDKMPNIECSITYDDEPANLHKHLEKEIADLARAGEKERTRLSIPLNIKPGTITTMVTDTELENKALKAMITIGLIHYNMMGSGGRSPDGLEYSWGAVHMYCRDIIKEAQDLEEAVTKLLGDKA